MKKRCRNIYRIARNNADLTQEKAAELLNVSVRISCLFKIKGVE